MPPSTGAQPGLSPARRRVFALVTLLGTLGGIAGAAGGITLPAGLLLGAAIGGSGAAIGSRGLVRLTRTIAKTPESRELWEAVDACAAILADAATREAELAVERLGAHVLTDRAGEDRALLDALRVAAAAPEDHA